MSRALPNLAAVLVLLINAWAADAFQRVQPEPVSFHLYVGLLFAVLAWLAVRGVLWAWPR